MTTTEALAPNHHAGYPGFAGPKGALMALLFAVRGREDAQLVSDLAGIGPGDHLVDIGCGPGNAVREASRRGARATGVDPAPVMLRVARLLTRPGRRTAWARGAAEAVPVPDGDATVACSMACVHHWADVDAGLQEVRRILGPGGQLLAIERQTEAGATGVASHGWLDQQADAFATRCTELGFADVTVTQATGRRGRLLVVRAVRP